jgi:hypothetical protein
MYWEDSIEYNGIMKNGYVTQKELLKVLKDLDVNITIRDINLLFSEVSVLNSSTSSVNQIKNNEFIKMIKLTDYLFPIKDDNDDDESKSGKCLKILEKYPDLLGELMTNTSTITQDPK